MAKRHDVRQIAFDPKQNCGKCRFFDGNPSYFSDHTDEAIARGHCKRFPPVPLIADPRSELDADPAIPSSKTRSDMRLIYERPLVDETTWCGEFQPSTIGVRRTTADRSTAAKR